MAQVGHQAVIAIAGSSGLIGSALAAALRAADHRVLRIVRRTPANSDELHWNPESGDFDPDALTEVDAVVNLCGVNIGQRRWSGAFKQSLRDSRITPTEVLANAVADAGVETLINASAVGYYGNTRDRVVDENDAAGSGFPRPAVRGLGSRHAAGPIRRRPGGAGPHRPGDGPGRRRAAPDAPAVLSGPGRPAGQRPSVHVVDQPRRRGAGPAVRDLAPVAVRPGEHDRARPGHQRRVHHRLRHARSTARPR